MPGWKAFVDYICDQMLDHSKYIWRGQRCDDWILEPTRDRLIRGAKFPVEHIFSSFDARQLEQFKFAVRGRRGPAPPPISDENENDWWALGQHHGLATPLLDWTTSPFVAAFFAFNETSTISTGHRAVFALHAPTLEGWSARNAEAERARRKERQAEIDAGAAPVMFEQEVLKMPVSPELVLVRPLSDENQRLVNQGGLFTRLRSQKKMEQWVMDNHPIENADGLSLLKILVPDEARAVCLRTLNRMNINPLSLFPDLGGASRYCNLFSEVENY